MEHPQGPRKPLSQRRARSLDRVQNPKKNSESWDCQCLFLPTTPSRGVLPRRASEGSRPPESLEQSAEAQGTMGAALSLVEIRQCLPREQRPPQDIKKDKAQRRAHPGWLKSILNFFLRTSTEETKEKAGKRTKGREGLLQPTETSEAPREPAPRKKAHDKKASCKKHSHKKHVDEETKEDQDQDTEGREAALPNMAAASHSKEADLSPAPTGEQTMSVSIATPLPHPQGLGPSKLAPPTSQQRVCCRWENYQGRTALWNFFEAEWHCGCELEVKPKFYTSCVTWGWQLSSLSLNFFSSIKWS